MINRFQLFLHSCHSVVAVILFGVLISSCVMWMTPRFSVCLFFFVVFEHIKFDKMHSKCGLRSGAFEIEFFPGICSNLNESLRVRCKRASSIIKMMVGYRRQVDTSHMEKVRPHFYSASLSFVMLYLIGLCGRNVGYFYDLKSNNKFDSL